MSFLARLRAAWRAFRTDPRDDWPEDVRIDPDAYETMWR